MKLCVLPDNTAAPAGTPCQAGTPRPAVAKAVSRCHTGSPDPSTPSPAPQHAEEWGDEGILLSGASRGLGQLEGLCRAGCARAAVPCVP